MKKELKITAKFLAIFVMSVVILIAASYLSSFWIIVVNFLAGTLPGGDEPIAVTIRGWLPTVRSLGTVIVLVLTGLIGWNYGKAVWQA